MLSIKLIVVGRLKERYWRDAVAEYVKRLGRFFKLEIAEVEDFSGDNSSAREGKLILTQLRGKVVLCDLDGEQMTSPGLADFLEKQALGTSQISIIIGGSHGVSDEIKQCADYKICFSKMTFPHQLFRVICLEQLYRGACISQGGNYHK